MPNYLGPKWIRNVILLNVNYEHAGGIWQVSEDDLRGCLIGQIKEVNTVLVPTDRIDFWLVVNEEGSQGVMEFQKKLLEDFEEFDFTAV